MFLFRNNDSVAQASASFLEVLQTHKLFGKFCLQEGIGLAADACMHMVVLTNVPQKTKQVAEFLQKWCSTLYGGREYGGLKKVFAAEEKVSKITLFL